MGRKCDSKQSASGPHWKGDTWANPEGVRAQTCSSVWGRAFKEADSPSGKGPEADTGEFKKQQREKNGKVAGDEVLEAAGACDS